VASSKNRILALNIGASKLVIAEFSAGKTGMPELVNYGVGQLGIEPEKEVDSSAYVVSTIRDVMHRNGIRPSPLLMTVSGQAVFPRYVKLPPVTRDKISQIVQYEAEQNVPFPIEQVVWDYQLISTDDDGSLNVMLAAVKIENVKRLTDCVQAAGLEPEIVDVATMALYNAVRYNYPDYDGCIMVLDIGARSSNLVFVEQDRIFSRSIPVAGNAITQELMKEFDLSFKDAEEMKLAHAFVAFGGVSAGPEGEVADRVSKIVRNVITRLHAEVNRSINFYRGQQGGKSPELVLLTGGSSVIPHTDTFFKEKLKINVEYLNPFVNISVGGGVPADRIAADMQLLGEVAGLALRRALKCPVEINLMPPDLVATSVFRRRQPFFALAAAGVVLILLCWMAYTYRTRHVRMRCVERVEQRIADLQKMSDSLKRVRDEKKGVEQKVESVLGVIAQRTQWIEILNTIHTCMRDGMWMTSLQPVLNADGDAAQVEIKITGFDDKLKTAPGEPNAFEELRDKLRKSDVFTEKTEITAMPVPKSDAYSRECKLLAELKQAIKLGKQDKTQ
jgi:type IV pilus assembly protein PilM